MAGQNCQITVNGKGAHVTPAERALLVLQAKSNEADSAKEATEIVTATANTLREMILPLFPTIEGTGRATADAAIVHYAMTSMGTSLQTYNRNKDDEKTLFSAKVDLHIKFRDFGALNGFATKVSAMDNVSVSEISWRLTDETALRASAAARKVAGKNAVERAYDFAQAVCDVPGAACAARVVPVDVTEDDYYKHSTRPQLHYAKGLRGISTGNHELQFEPEDVSVEVSVTARFEVIKE